MAEERETIVAPHNMDAEASVLGAGLLDNEQISNFAALLKPEDFFHRANQLLFAAMVRLDSERSKIDVVTLHAALEKQGVLQEAGGRPYLVQVMETLPSTANAITYAELVKECSIRRQLIRAADEIRLAAIRGREDAAHILDLAEQRVFEIAHDEGRNDVQSVSDILVETFNHIYERQGAKGGITGLTTGFYKLDDKTAGFQRGDLIVIAARPSMGKTTFALNCALNACFSGGKILFFSLEMASPQILTNMLCATARVDASRVRRGQCTTQDYEKLQEAAVRMHELQFLIDSSSGISPMSIRTKARRAKAHGDKLDLIVIDYLQLMQVPGAESRQQEISIISRALKELAREMGCPVIALSQLNRALEARKDHRPQLSDLRESGAIEQDADLIMFLHREDYFTGESVPPDQGRKTELIIGKQRNGPTGKLDLLFFPNQLRFENSAEGGE